MLPTTTFAFALRGLSVSCVQLLSGAMVLGSMLSRPLSYRTLVSIVLVAMACSRAPTTSPPGVAAQTEAARGDLISRDTNAESEPASATPVATVPAEDEESAPLAPPIETEESWLAPLPPVDLTPGSVDLAARDRCVERYQLQSKAPEAENLFAGAKCVGAAGAIGAEVTLLRVFLTKHPEADSHQEAWLRLGLRYEQIGRHADALETYLEFVRRYPIDRTAITLGKRGLCLAHSLHDTATYDELNRKMRGYSRKGYFLEPTADTLPALCEPRRSV